MSQDLCFSLVRGWRDRTVGTVLTWHKVILNSIRGTTFGFEFTLYSQKVQIKNWDKKNSKVKKREKKIAKWGWHLPGTCLTWV